MTSNNVCNYYILGDRPIKVTCNQFEIPMRAEIYSAADGQFIADLEVIKMITDDRNIKKIDKSEFENACLAKGLKPI
ncbi:MAG: hypothetical protein ACRBDI_07615 [Alphaproteobacteria bacterium]